MTTYRAGQLMTMLTILRITLLAGWIIFAGGYAAFGVQPFYDPVALTIVMFIAYFLSLASSEAVNKYHIPRR